LLRDVSHELRSPLARIQMAASLSIKKHGKSTEIDRIETEVTRLDGLIEDLLSLSRLQSGGGLTDQSIDVGKLLQQVCDDANFEFQTSKKSVVVHVDHNLKVKGDSDLLTSAFENVIRNAVRFSPEDEVVEVTAIRKGQSIEVLVTDLGPGVDEELLSRIFDPFFKADQARSESSGQHGIGLALCRAIIELHNGSIVAQNQSPNGLSVTITLPL
ncbi:MAG: sensor histidine kinase, partial [bacterium]